LLVFCWCNRCGHNAAIDPATLITSAWPSIPGARDWPSYAVQRLPDTRHRNAPALACTWRANGPARITPPPAPATSSSRNTCHIEILARQGRIR
jgi:hypothetical protein